MSTGLHKGSTGGRGMISLKSVMLYVAIMLGLNAYLFSRYEPQPLPVEQISFSSDLDAKDLAVYFNYDRSEEIDFTKAYVPQRSGERFVVNPAGSGLRRFRIYIGRSVDSLSLSDVSITLGSGEKALSLAKFRTEKLKKWKDGLYTSEADAFFELKRSLISIDELCIAEGLIFVLSLILCMAIMYLWRHHLADLVKPFSLKTLGISIYIASIFLPLPYFNIAFMISFAIIVKDFNYRQFLSNKAGLLILLYFVWFVINNAFVSDEFNMKLFETLLPFFFLPFYTACLPRVNTLPVFPLSALFLSFYFITSSCIDFSFYRSLSCFSFDAFTKYVHPVYVSYLLVFSLIYIELEGRGRFNKFLFIPVLGIALLCCGSKLMIILTGLFYALRLFKKKPYFGYAFLIITVGVIFLFAPTRKRFQEIVNPKSFSILKEDPILSKHDERLTGVTVRLIIWQESLETFDHVKRVLVGQGVDQKADRLLQDRLTSRNVDASHIKYDPHNQYITTFYKLGLAGLLLLVLLCVCVFRIAYLRHNRLLVFTMLLFVIAMFTESVLQRATGIFFFLTLILLQTFLILNPTHLENSNPGDQGNS